MRVKWSESIDIPEMYIEEMMDNAESIDWYRHYEGEVIGTNSSFWHGETLTIACEDGKVRTVAVDKVKVVKDE